MPAGTNATIQTAWNNVYNNITKKNFSAINFCLSLHILILAFKDDETEKLIGNDALFSKLNTMLTQNYNSDPSLKIKDHHIKRIHLIADAFRIEVRAPEDDLYQANAHMMMNMCYAFLGKTINNWFEKQAKIKKKDAYKTVVKNKFEAPVKSFLKFIAPSPKRRKTRNQNTLLLLILGTILILSSSIFLNSYYNIALEYSMLASTLFTVILYSIYNHFNGQPPKNTNSIPQTSPGNNLNNKGKALANNTFNMYQAFKKTKKESALYNRIRKIQKVEPILEAITHPDFTLVNSSLSAWLDSDIKSSKAAKVYLRDLNSMIMKLWKISPAQIVANSYLPQSILLGSCLRIFWHQISSSDIMTQEIGKRFEKFLSPFTSKMSDHAIKIYLADEKQFRKDQSIQYEFSKTPNIASSSRHASQQRPSTPTISSS